LLAASQNAVPTMRHSAGLGPAFMKLGFADDAHAVLRVRICLISLSFLLRPIIIFVLRS
jgi:hypothetical protein